MRPKGTCPLRGRKRIRIMIIHIENVGVYDINVDEPYSNFIAEVLLHITVMKNQW
jgi:hypothetical protein